MTLSNSTTELTRRRESKTLRRIILVEKRSAVASNETTRRYTHTTDRAKRAAVEAVRVLRENVCYKSATMQERLPRWQPLVNRNRSEEHTSELQSHSFISYA